MPINNIYIKSAFSLLFKGRFKDSFKVTCFLYKTYSGNFKISLKELYEVSALIY